MDRFSTWLDTMLDEKGIDLDRVHEIEGPSGANFIPLACVVEAIKGAGAGEQSAIKHQLVRIDFRNGSVEHFLLHLAKAIAI